jgi:hypothetical protein
MYLKVYAPLLLAKVSLMPVEGYVSNGDLLDLRAF